VFDQIGTFDVAYGITSDADWFARAKDAGVVVAVLPETLLYRRIHSGNLSGEVGQIQSELLRIMRVSVARQRAQESKQGEQA
jgi:hypothetical protein